MLFLERKILKNMKQFSFAGRYCLKVANISFMYKQINPSIIFTRHPLLYKIFCTIVSDYNFLLKRKLRSAKISSLQGIVRPPSG